ncbi:MAG: LCP family protein [Candidatus Altimarinota bacterium]
MKLNAIYATLPNGFFKRSLVNQFTRKSIQNDRKPDQTPKKIHTSLFRKIVRSIPTSKAEYRQKKVPFFFLVLFLLFSAFIIFKVVYTTYQYITYFDLKDLVGIISTDLQKDDKGRTNILLLGTGGEGHDGADLTDTIIVASLNAEKKTVSLFSIPRDLWLDLPGYQSSRVNKIYEILKGTYGSEQSLEILRHGIENITNLSIPYHVKVDFDAFINVVDLLGGVEVVVEKSIYDTEYPKEDESGYETFSIEAGTHLLDGSTALKFARSRHSTSDFDRAARQHKILNALKTKAQEADLLSSPLLLKKLYNEFEDHVETNISTLELIGLGQLAQDFDQENITSAVLIDTDILDMGSFLYTPERQLYGGAFVLVPIGNTYEDIQRFIALVFDFPEFFQEDASIQILNGTNRFGLAAQLGQKLIPYGFNVQRYDNADRKDYTTTHYYIHKPEQTRVTDEVIQLFFPGAIKMKGAPPAGINTDYDLSIITGQDLDLTQF